MAPSRAALAKIHIAKKELGLTDEVYRDILSMRFKVDSAAKLSDRQATVLLDTFKDKGWKSRQTKKQTSSPRYDDRQKRKIVAIWITLHQEGAIRNGKDQALQAFVKRLTGVDNLKWCGPGDCYKLIEALKSMAERNGVALD